MEYEEGLLDVGNADSAQMEDACRVASPPADQLERCGTWLLSIPRDDVMVLRQTPEYQDFLQAFESLGHAHRKVISMNRSSMSIEDLETMSDVHQVPSFPDQLSLSQHSNNFLQHLTADDVILRVFEFLECQSLIRTAMTCSRFRQLANQSATQRTYDVANARQLNTVMQLLRAKEQIDGVGTGIHDSHVRVPILLLSRRVHVVDAGDPEYNGVYFCTGSNGNGFVFTKPRSPEQRVQTTASGVRFVQRAETPPIQLPVRMDPALLLAQGPAGVAAEGVSAARFESEVAQPGQLLRCIIAKRFSNEVRTLTALEFLISLSSCI